MLRTILFLVDLIFGRKFLNSLTFGKKLYFPWLFFFLDYLTFQDGQEPLNIHKLKKSCEMKQSRTSEEKLKFYCSLFSNLTTLAYMNNYLDNTGRVSHPLTLHNTSFRAHLIITTPRIIKTFCLRLSHEMECQQFQTQQSYKISVKPSSSSTTQACSFLRL